MGVETLQRQIADIGLIFVKNEKEAIRIEFEVVQTNCLVLGLIFEASKN